MERKPYFIYVIIICFCLFITGCSKKSPTDSGNGKKQYKIAYSSTQEGHWEIYIMNTDGSNPQRLTNHETISSEPDWSPDGTKIVYSSGDEIYVIDINGENLKHLSNNAPSAGSPLWSPNGDKISFVTDNAELYVINPDGTNQMKLTNRCWGPAKWSPDGTKILFTYWWPANVIKVINADGTGLQTLSDEYLDQGPDWSPDGKAITFFSYRDNNNEIYSMDSDGSNQQRLTNNQADDMSPKWSPDGIKIAFVSDRHDENGEVYVMNSEGTNQVRVSDVPRFVYLGPVWSPNADKIAFIEAETSSGGSKLDIWVVNADGTDQKKLTDNEGIDSSPAWSPIPVF